MFPLLDPMLNYIKLGSLGGVSLAVLPPPPCSQFYDFPFGLKETDFGKQTTNCKVPSSCFTAYWLKAPLHAEIFIGKVCLF